MEIDLLISQREPVVLTVSGIRSGLPPFQHFRGPSWQPRAGDGRQRYGDQLEHRHQTCKNGLRPQRRV
jgi:hypothetical protein